MRSKELSIELWDRIMLRQISGERYQNISAVLKVPKNTVASIILGINLEPSSVKGLNSYMYVNVILANISKICFCFVMM
jgi:hypothetical protein